MGPPLWSQTLDAYDCIMVPFQDWIDRIQGCDSRDVTRFTAPRTFRKSRNTRWAKMELDIKIPILGLFAQCSGSRINNLIQWVNFLLNDNNKAENRLSANHRGGLSDIFGKEISRDLIGHRDGSLSILTLFSLIILISIACKDKLDHV